MTDDPALAPTAFPPFDNSYARDLPGFATPWRPVAVAAPALLFFNAPLAAELGLDAAALQGPVGAAVFAGNLVPEGAEPVAQAYAGHQFGGFSPQLGDGRALLLGELIDRQGRRRDIAFKGSGRTPYSRGGDGRAAVGPMLREVLISEALHALGLPTTRALAVAATGEWVYREERLPGAVLTRVAASHLRVGTFQFFAARGEGERVRQLADYTIARHDADLAGTPGRYRALLERVARRQAALVARWMGLGFIHGVMNTDNMTISGETIDYGPCAFMEAFDPGAVFSSIDHQGRYAYANQPGIARWNLARLAETLLPLLSDDADAAVTEATAVINAFPDWYQAEWQGVWRAKLGLAASSRADDAGDTLLAEAWLRLLQEHAVDFTRAARHLADAAAGDETPLRGLFDAADGGPAGITAWLGQWQARRTAPGTPDAAALRAANPRIIPRNHRVEEALAAATDGDLAPFETLLAALRRPFDDDPTLAPFAEPAPAALTAGYRTFCGT